MTAATLTRSTWGLSTPRDDRPWWRRAACIDTPHLHTADVARGVPTAKDPHALAAHICRHCPVLAQCYAEAKRTQPREVVQAGLWWPIWQTRQPKRLPDPGCGPWCWQLRERSGT